VLFVLAEAWRSIQEKQLGRFVQGSGLALVGVVLALLCNTGLLWSTYEYGQHTTRGPSELTINPDGSSAADIRTTGLDRDYVVQWSYGKQESFSLLVPNVKGGASGYLPADKLDDADPRFREMLGRWGSYWGDQMFTSGPVYLGAIVVLLMLLALAQAEGKARWWILGSIAVIPAMLAVQSPPLAFLLLGGYLVAGIFLWKDTLGYALYGALLLTLALSWGSNYMPLTDFFLDHIPGYNKFRAVTIILVIVELCAPVLGVLYLDRLLKNGGWEKAQEKRFLIPAAGLVLLLLVMAVAPTSLFDFVNDQERSSFSQQAESSPEMEAQVVAFADQLKAIRVGIFKADVFRSLAFVLAAAVLVFLAGRRIIGRTILIAGLGLLILIDLWAVDKRYVNNEQQRGRYAQWEQKGDGGFQRMPDPADIAILKAETTPAVEAEFNTMLARARELKSGKGGRASLVSEQEQLLLRFGALRRHTNYRVSTLGSPFQDANVSYLHKSIGGYHGAKLKRYAELIEFHMAPELQQFSSGMKGATSMAVIDSALAGMTTFNMLNTKYFIYDPSKPPIPNRHAMGSAWFVDELRWVKSADEEITALRTIDPRRTALVDERFRTALGEGPVSADSTATVELTTYRTNHLTYTVSSASGGVVVFSEIWYGPDWHATIDGQPVEHARADYVLRALRVPAGKHTVEFRIQSRTYTTGSTITMAGSAAVILLVIGVFVLELRRKRREGDEAAA